MPFEDSIARRSLESRARRARRMGEVQEAGHSVRPIDDGGVNLRAEGRFSDSTGQTIIGFATWASSTWGP